MCVHSHEHSGILDKIKISIKITRPVNFKQKYGKAVVNSINLKIENQRYSMKQKLNVFIYIVNAKRSSQGYSSSKPRLLEKDIEG